MVRKRGDALRNKNASPKDAKSTKSQPSHKGKGANQPRTEPKSWRSKDQEPPSHDSQPKPATEPKHWLDYATAVLALLAAVGALAAAGFTGYQAYIAETTAQRQLRAYVEIRDSNLKLSENGEVVARIVIENFGQTPAYDIGVASKTFVDDPKNPGVLISDIAELTAYAAVGPRSTLTQTAHRKKPITAEELAAVRRGEKAIFVQGLVRFRDAFDDVWLLRFERVWGKHTTRGSKMAIGPHGDKTTRQPKN